jgi:putative membrane protein insertion efficiency factor
MKKSLLFIIRTYQVSLSAILPFNYCRFYPSCSEYAMESIKTHGSLKGLWLAAIRILKCHPFSPASGYDPVPVKKEK